MVHVYKTKETLIVRIKKFFLTAGTFISDPVVTARNWIVVSVVADQAVGLVTGQDLATAKVLSAVNCLTIHIGDDANRTESGQFCIRHFLVISTSQL
jgi:hypothetical protein